MNYKSITYITLFLSISTLLYAQTAPQIKADTSYIWAEGTGSTISKADQAALQELMTQISYSISSEGYTRIGNTETANSTKSSTEFTQIIKTYSTATLHNTQKLTVAEKTDKRTGEYTVTVMRYLKKSEINKLFEMRKAKAQEFTRLAHRDLERQQIGDALRYLYWAHAMVQSLQYPSEAVVSNANGESVSASTYLTECINNILTGLKVAVVAHPEESIYELSFMYKNHLVASLDYMYWDGADWSIPTTAIDGKGLIELRPGFTANDLRLRIEYQYLGEAQTDKEIQQVLDAISEKHFPKADIHIKLQNKQKAVETSTPKSAPQPTAKITSSNGIEHTMAVIVNAVKTKNYNNIKGFFTEDGFDTFTRLIHYGNARIIGTPKLQYDTLDNYIYCRSIPMQFSFSKERKFSENIVFVFDETGKIDNVQFGLSKVAEKDVMTNPEWSTAAKLILQNFLENYKTAYALKRLDYIEQIFADDALIITGKVVYKKEGDAENGYRTNKHVLKTQYDKKTYIKQLRNVFASQEFINIRFADNLISKIGAGDERYAIQIKQDYFSASYGDSGYLFILVDVNNPKQPIIHVRVWQEEPDPEWGIMGPGHF